MQTPFTTNIKTEKETWVKPVVEIIAVKDETLGGFTTTSSDLAFGLI